MRQRILIAALVAILISPHVGAQGVATMYMGLGDSIGEGVQSADASSRTQPYSFLHILALLMGAPLPVPFIETNLFGQVGSTSGRVRIDPTVHGLNLAVSGASTGDLLNARADAATSADINSEIDLVLFPRQASQIEIIEQLRPQFVACWIGNNDALGSVSAFDQLDGVSGLTPVPEFQANFSEIAARLDAAGSKVVFGTIPNVTQIAYLLDRNDLIRLTGQDYGLPHGVYTTIVAALAVQLGAFDPSVLTQPNFTLDQAEIANINQRISEFNDVIRTTAALHGMAVADIAAVFDALATNPPVLFGVPLTTRFLGGLFSLDGVHPSNVGQLLVAKFFGDAFNSHYGLNIAPVTPELIGSFLLTDPFVDKDGDGRVIGRFGAGLLETVSYLVGWSGDTDDAIPTASLGTTSTNMAGAVAAIEQSTGKRLRGAPRDQQVEILGELFGLKPLFRRRAATPVR
jgi:hypothetical protein